MLCALIIIHLLVIFMQANFSDKHIKKGCTIVQPLFLILTHFILYKLKFYILGVI